MSVRAGVAPTERTEASKGLRSIHRNFFPCLTLNFIPCTALLVEHTVNSWPGRLSTGPGVVQSIVFAATFDHPQSWENNRDSGSITRFSALFLSAQKKLVATSNTRNRTYRILKTAV